MTRIRCLFRRRDALWLLALIVYALAGTPLVPFHGDESTLIFMGRDYYYQFVQRDLELVTYHDPPISATEQQLRLLNGTVSKYLYGLTTHIAGYTIDDLNDQWDWGAGWNYNQQSGRVPSSELLLTARWPSALMLAASVVVLFAIGMTLGGRTAAYSASLYYALNPVVLLNGRRAMMEGGLALFGLLTVLAGIWFLRRRDWRTALLLGIASGLAIASKHTATFTVVAAFGVCGLYFVLLTLTPAPTPPLRLHGRGEKKTPSSLRVGQLVFAGVVALVVFYALNPAWWGDPVGRAQEVLEERGKLLDGQTAAFGGYEDTVDKLAGFLRQSFIVHPAYYEDDRWGGYSYIGNQIEDYESSPWGGVSIGGSLPGALVVIVLVALGGWQLWHRPRVDKAVRLVIGLWALAMVLATLLLTPLEWQRYYSPVYPAIALLGGMGIAAFVDRTTGRSRNR